MQKPAKAVQKSGSENGFFHSSLLAIYPVIYEAVHMMDGF